MWQEDLRIEPGKVLDDLTIVSQHNSLNGELLGHVMIRYSHLLLINGLRSITSCPVSKIQKMICILKGMGQDTEFKYFDKNG